MKERTSELEDSAYHSLTDGLDFEIISLNQAISLSGWPELLGIQKRAHLG